ncbi:hypothetical protein [Streptococcus uberis]|uniref:hypothetical protein n=1 Tax=Streptococcus uberis TaxID=1349 RepID=UPI0012B53526|nr:hypothetical protein [Streptococcus uberis]MTB99882.1 hypothetical protein [Streptococcus uberis]
MNGYIGLLIIVSVSIIGVVFLKRLFTKTYSSSLSDKAGQESGFTYIIHFKDLDEISKFWENKILKDKISIISENKKGTTYTVSSKYNDQKLKTSLMTLYDLRADQVSVTSSVMFTGAL